ncbi:MAG: radical SAM protein [Thermoplasmatota archaeon]
MRRITIYRPGRSFPSVSVTGHRCAMSCAHCSGKYLGGMKDVSGKGALLEFGLDLWKKGGKGILVSGGCDQFGAVDFPSYTFKEIKDLKERTGLLINLHCGLINEDVAGRISWAGVDKVSFDFVYDDTTINEVLRLDKGKEEYLATVDILMKQGVEVVPHILAGLKRGEISWEFDAVKVLSGLGSVEVVLIVLIPTIGTDFQDVEPPSLQDLLHLARYMREKLGGRLVLGCMRPKDLADLEVEVLKAGFDGIVLPRRSTLEWITSMGYEVEEKGICCCMG